MYLNQPREYEPAFSENKRFNLLAAIVANILFSSALFALFFEWSRYELIVGRENLGGVDQDIAIIGIAVSKTLVWFVPLLPAFFALTYLDYHRLAKGLLGVSWVGFYFYMISDLASFGFAGFHLWDYAPYFHDIVRSPGNHIWQWAGERLIFEAGLVLIILAVICPGWMSLFNRFTPIIIKGRPRWIYAIGIALLPLILASTLPVFENRLKPHLSARIMPALPFPPLMHSSLNSFHQQMASLWGIAGWEKIGISIASASNSAETTQLRIYAGFDIPKNKIVDREGTPGEIARSSVGPKIQASLSMVPQNSSRQDLTAIERVREIVSESMMPRNVDSQTRIENNNLPNVVLIIFESFRPSALSPEIMSRLHEWSQTGMRFNNHYSGSNCSHLGLFSLFYSRSPYGFHEVLDKKIPAQTFETLRNSGYEIQFLTSGETKGFRRLDEFINEKSCDKIQNVSPKKTLREHDWPKTDSRKIARAGEILSSSHDKPQFIFFYLVSCHYPYMYPQDKEVYPGNEGLFRYLSAQQRISNHRNRYANSMLFLEDQIMQMLKKIDPKKTIVAITGDHGESMGEDGVFTHGSRMSDAQLKVPFVMAGAGVPQMSFSESTTHMDFLPTLGHILNGRSLQLHNIHGRDILAENFVPEPVSVVPAWGQDWNGMLIINGDRRSAFRVSDQVRSKKIEYAGEVNTTGTITDH